MRPLRPAVFVVPFLIDANPILATQSIILSKRVRYPPVFVVNTRSEDTQPAKNVASPASFAKLFAQLKPSQSRLKSVRMAAGGQQDTILT